jgi:ADP-ribose pyrophosphatase
MNIQRPVSKQPIPDHAKRVFKGVLFDTYQWEQEMYDGRKATFEKLKRPDTVSIFPVLPNGRILLIEDEQPGSIPYNGPAGGRVDEGEDILSAAKRELLEETGYEAEEYILWEAKHPVQKIDWVIYTFIAKGLKKVADAHLDGGEKIKIKEVTFDEFVDLVTDSQNDFDKEIIQKFFEAKLNPKKMEELEELFKPLE